MPHFNRNGQSNFFYEVINGQMLTHDERRINTDDDGEILILISNQSASSDLNLKIPDVLYNTSFYLNV